MEEGGSLAYPESKGVLNFLGNLVWVSVRGRKEGRMALYRDDRGWREGREWIE